VAHTHRSVEASVKIPDAGPGINAAQVGAILRHAARILRRNGLHQGSYYDPDQHRYGTVPAEECRMCALGAVNTAVTGSPSVSLAREDLRVVMRHLNAYMATVHDETTVPEWNDQPGRPVVQVALLLLRAAAWRPAPAEVEPQTLAA
jgi:hypothetical protein